MSANLSFVLLGSQEHNIYSNGKYLEKLLGKEVIYLCYRTKLKAQKTMNFRISGSDETLKFNLT